MSARANSITELEYSVQNYSLYSLVTPKQSTLEHATRINFNSDLLCFTYQEEFV